MATTLTAKSRPSAAPINRSRVLTIAGAAIAAVAVWAIAVPVLGDHLTIRFGAGAAQTVGVGFIVAGAVLGGALGWGLLAFLERRTARARTIWTVAAIVVLLATFALPLIAATTLSAKVALVLMHLAVGSVLILGLRGR